MSITPVQQANIASGTRVLLRSSLNVPMHAGKVLDTFRLEESARTIQYLQKIGAKTIMIGHLGREGETLAPVHQALQQFATTTFIPSLTGEAVYQARQSLKAGETVLLENTRIDEGEEKGDVTFIDELIQEAEAFVFDDFSVAHREHASVVGPFNSLPTYAGIRFYEEITALKRLVHRVVHPSVAIIGGAKIETKLPILQTLVKTYSTVFIGGVMANTFLKQRGIPVGASKVDDTPIPQEILYHPQIVLPHFVVVRRGDAYTTVRVDAVTPEDVIVDIGVETIQAMGDSIAQAQTILWNGPLGLYEKGFFASSLALSEAVGKSSAYAVVGGGDTVTLLRKHNHQAYWHLLSTGGGAMLHYLAHGTLPVLDAFASKDKTT